MQHRHLETAAWTRAAIDSVLEYGDLPQWRQLFQAARENHRVAADIRFVASRHDLGGASALAIDLVERICPGRASVDTI